MSLKISLFKYMTGQLDIEKGTTLQLRKTKAKNRPPHPSMSKGTAAAGSAPKAVATVAANTNFTAAEDARILEWKAVNEGKPWKALADEMGKSQALIKERFKELKAGDEGGGGEPAGAASDKGKDKEKGKGKGEGDAAAGVSEKDKKGGAKNGDKGAAKSNAKDNTKGKGGKGAVDGEEAELVRFLAREDDEDKWLRIASRLFDRTGRAVHPDDLKEKYGK